MTDIKYNGDQFAKELWCELVTIPPFSIDKAERIHEQLQHNYDMLEDTDGSIREFLSALGQEIARCHKEKDSLRPSGS